MNGTRVTEVPVDHAAAPDLSFAAARGRDATTAGRVGRRPALDLTRLVTTAEVVAGAVLVAHQLSRRPTAAKAVITMGPGGWVSMKGGTVAVRRARRPWGRPRAPRSPSTTRRPVWARVLGAVPLRSLR